eukprot:IDg6218t1
MSVNPQLRAASQRRTRSTGGLPRRGSEQNFSQHLLDVEAAAAQDAAERVVVQATTEWVEQQTQVTAPLEEPPATAAPFLGLAPAEAVEQTIPRTPAEVVETGRLEPGPPRAQLGVRQTTSRPASRPTSRPESRVASPKNANHVTRPGPYGSQAADTAFFYRIPPARTAGGRQIDSPAIEAEAPAMHHSQRGPTAMKSSSLKEEDFQVLEGIHQGRTFRGSSSNRGNNGARGRGKRRGNSRGRRNKGGSKSSGTPLHSTTINTPSRTIKGSSRTNSTGPEINTGNVQDICDARYERHRQERAGEIHDAITLLRNELQAMRSDLRGQQRDQHDRLVRVETLVTLRDQERNQYSLPNQEQPSVPTRDIGGNGTFAPLAVPLKAEQAPLNRKVVG